MTTPPPGNLADADTQIADRISNALIIRNVTMQALSEKTGIAYPTLRRSLNGFRSLTIREIGRIAEALNLPARTLMPPELVEAGAQ
jgi:transcriptional regulator with XRE-family HTH domain